MNINQWILFEISKEEFLIETVIKQLHQWIEGISDVFIGLVEKRIFF